MPTLEALLGEADRLREEEGQLSAHYLEVLARIESKPKLWRSKYGSFAALLAATRHGPLERYVTYKRTVELVEAYDEDRVQKGERLGRSTLDVVGFYAASQVRDVRAADRHKVLDALRGAALRQRKPLTYQAATQVRKHVLKEAVRPKSARGQRYRDLIEEIERLKAKIIKQASHIAIYRKRLRDAGKDDSPPTI